MHTSCSVWQPTPRPQHDAFRQLDLERIWVRNKRTWYACGIMEFCVAESMWKLVVSGQCSKNLTLSRGLAAPMP